MPVPLSRRELLARSANGFGAAALAALLAADEMRAEDGRAKPGRSPNDPFAPKKPHFTPKAKSVIVLSMDGGPSQVDTFDPKPRSKSTTASRSRRRSSRRNSTTSAPR